MALFARAARQPIELERERHEIARTPRRRSLLERWSVQSDNRHVREVESQLTVVRAGHGTDLYGVREFRSGDALRRIHWRTSARRGQLVVREFEPPGLRALRAPLRMPSPGSLTFPRMFRVRSETKFDLARNKMAKAVAG